MDERPTTGVDEEAPPSAAEALALIAREQARTEPSIGPFFVVWGTAWLVIGLAWFGAGQGAITGGPAGSATVVVIVLGSLASALLGRRIGRGVSGPSSRSGAAYGWAWFLAMIGTGALVGGLSRLGGPGVGVLAPALFLFVVGVLYTVGGALWRSRIDYVLGLVVQATGVVSVFTPVPWNSLLLGVAGGGALITVGVLRIRESRRR